MQAAIKQALCTVIERWNRMKESGEAHAEEDANQFEASFYQLMDSISDWLDELESKPESLHEALDLPEIVDMVTYLPAELYLNFETELELIIDGEVRTEDAKYD